MRMQKTDMEFVTFDAQDVIMTSNAKAWFQATASLVPDHINDYSGLGRAGFSWDWGSTGQNISKVLSIEGAPKAYLEEEGAYYQLDEKSTGTINNGTYSIQQATKINGQGVGDKLTTLDDIFVWLSKNVNQ